MMYDTAMTAAFTLFFFKQKTAYEMRISDWSSDVCSSDLRPAGEAGVAGCAACAHAGARRTGGGVTRQRLRKRPDARLGQCADAGQRDPADPVRQRPAGRSDLSLRLRRTAREHGLTSDGTGTCPRGTSPTRPHGAPPPPTPTPT